MDKTIFVFYTAADDPPVEKWKIPKYPSSWKFIGRYSMNDAQYIKIFDASKGFICVKTIHLSTFPKEMNILKIRYSKKSKCLGITYYVPPHEQHFIYWYDFATKRSINTHIIPDKLYYSYFTKHLNLYINNKKYLNPFNKPAIRTAIRDELCDTVCN